MRVLITGGAGFIGSATSRYFIGAGHQVAILEDFSRPGSRANLQWVEQNGVPDVYEGSVADSAFVVDCFSDFRPDAIIHLAAQVAVTKSVEDPRTDFETNAIGTFNLLEAMRTRAPLSRLIFASTNKVYGDLEYLSLVEGESRYLFPPGTRGIDELTPLDFHSPYGCSKGSADAYVSDYSRIWGLNTTVLRQSCIFGTRQFGIEDQGWIAWFVIAALVGRDIKIFGNGKQVRDALWVNDLVRLYERLLLNGSWSIGQVFNVGGGPANTLSVLELLDEISDRVGRPVDHEFFEARQGDQKIFVSDNSKVKKELGWEPKISVKQGLGEVFDWVSMNHGLIEKTLSEGS